MADEVAMKYHRRADFLWRIYDTGLCDFRTKRDDADIICADTVRAIRPYGTRCRRRGRHAASTFAFPLAPRAIEQLDGFSACWAAAKRAWRWCAAPESSTPIGLAADRLPVTPLMSKVSAQRDDTAPCSKASQHIYASHESRVAIRR